MTLLLNLSPDLERRLRAEAAQRGVEPTAYILRLLETTLPPIPIPQGLAGLRDLLHQISPYAEMGGAYKAFGPLLERALASLEEADVAALTEEDRQHLYRALDIFYALLHPESVLAVLRLIERLRDLEALPMVRALAASVAVSPNSLRVREEARRLLATLARQEEQQRKNRMLLRPAPAPDSGGTLLRPAHGAPDTDADRLLRPIEAGRQEETSG